MAVLCNVMKFHTEVCNFYSSVFPSYYEMKQRYQLPPENYFVFAYPTLWSCWTHDWWLWQAGIAKSQLGKHTKNRILSLRVYVCMYLSRGKVEKGRPFISPITPSAAIVVRSFHAVQEKWRWCLSGIGCRGEGYHDNPLGGRDAAGGD